MLPSGPRLTCCTLLAQLEQKWQNRFCNIEPSLVTDSSEASKDGPEASDDSTDVDGAWSARATALCLLLVARARCGAAAH